MQPHFTAVAQVHVHPDSDFYLDEHIVGWLQQDGREGLTLGGLWPDELRVIRGHVRCVGCYAGPVAVQRVPTKYVLQPKPLLLHPTCTRQHKDAVLPIMNASHSR